MERYLDEYVAAAKIGEQAEGPLFRTAASRTGTLTVNGLSQKDAYQMVQRRAKAGEV